jgi:hypothetical protein
LTVLRERPPNEAAFLFVFAFAFQVGAGGYNFALFNSVKSSVECVAGGFMKNRIEAHIDEIVAMCDGDLRGALKALMLVNELLETQLERLHVTGICDEDAERRVGWLH